MERQLKGSPVADFTNRYKSKDGSYKTLEWRATFVKEGIVHATARDITERKQAEVALKESEEKFSKAFRIAPEPMTITTLKEGIFIDINETYTKIYGYQREEVIGHTSLELGFWPSPEQRDQILQILQERGAVNEFEIEHLIKSGDIRTALFSAEIIKLGDEQCLIASVKDITDRKQAEEREKQLQQELNLASRLASVGQLAAGIAHEINNPLTGVIGFSDLLMKKDIPEDIRKDVEIIYDGSQRVAGITSRMLTYARQSKPEQTMVDINDIINATLDMRNYAMESSSIKVTTQLDSDLPTTMADAGQLQQVFLNIILNAETEMINTHDKGNLTIKTERIDNTIQVSFKDDGPGIPNKNLDKIFNPFFTTREVGKGAGLGLSVSHGIVHQHGGKIYAKSKIGKGATFIVELPIVTKEEQLKLAEPAIQPGKVAKARILVVDDDTIVQEFLTEILREEGHEVEIIDNGNDALEKFESEDYDLILLDIKLPGMSGIELYEHLQKKAKSLTRKVIFITGDTMSTDTMVFIKSSQTPYITKPFNVEELMKSIDRVLTEGS